MPGTLYRKVLIERLMEVTGKRVIEKQGGFKKKKVIWTRCLQLELYHRNTQGRVRVCIHTYSLHET